MSNEVENILVVYKEMMEEMRERRRTEWQTFIVVNFFYLSLLNGLQWLGNIPLLQALAITFVIIVFSYIWLIRIYGNAVRFRFNQKVRNDIGKDERFPCKEITQKALEAQKDLGWSGWKNKEDCIPSPNWAFFGYRGICFAIVLYCLILVSVLWIYKVKCDIQPVCAGVIVIVLAVVVVIVGVIVDIKLARSGRA